MDCQKDSHREEHYQNLINKLLKCPSEQEVNILSEQGELVNQTLLEKMSQRAQLLLELGNQEGANFLNKLIFVIEDSQKSKEQPFIRSFQNSLQKFEQKKREEQLALIQELVNCPSGQESEVLNSQPHLLDGSLTRMMLEVSVDLNEQGYRDIAIFLRNVSSQLGEALVERNKEPYAAFIHLLLNCPQGSERNLINSRPDLVNDVLVRFMEQVASRWETVGKHKEAILLQRLAGQIDAELKDESPYLRLVHDLVNCDNTQEEDIINNSKNLIGRNLSQTAEQIAMRMDKIGDTNNAKWLREKIRQIRYEFLVEALLNADFPNDLLILKANSDITDVGLLEFVQKYVIKLKREGKDKQATWLKDFFEQE